MEALGEEISLADGGEGDSWRLGRIDSGVEEIGGIVDDGQAGILTAGVAWDGLLFKRSAGHIDRIREARDELVDIREGGVAEARGIVGRRSTIEEMGFAAIGDDGWIEDRFALPVVLSNRLEEWVLFGTLKCRPFGRRCHELVEELREAGGRDAGGRIGGTVVEHDGIALNGDSGRKDDVRDLAVELVFFLRDEERGIGTADDAGRVLEIEQRGFDGEKRRTAPVIADIGIEDEPTV